MNSMKKRFKLLKSFLKYLWVSRYYRGHGVHSPFLYKFVRHVIFKKEKKSRYKDIGFLKKRLRKDNRFFEINDPGAGSKKLRSERRKIADIVKNSAIKPKYGRLLTRMIENLQPKILIELGTSLGISTSYILKGAKERLELHTIEGVAELAEIAKENIGNLNLSGCSVYNSDFDNCLPEILNKIEMVDFVFFDGNHTKDATIRYFELCLNKINNNSVFVFDDIHWSVEMEQAWNYIKGHEKVKVSIDLFQFGIVFFREEMMKEDYVIKFL